jgi:hypothetical protein
MLKKLKEKEYYMETKNLTIGFAAAGIILLIIASGVFGQPSVHDVAGTANLNGNPVIPGTLIEAKDANGTERGNFTTTISGFYGIMHVNGDDPNSTGDVISFFINGTQAEQVLIWQPFGYDPNFGLKACDLSTYAITVQTDSSTYFQGQNMVVSGYLMNSECVLQPNKSVAYSVPNTAIMGQTQTNGTGYFSVVIAIPSDMPFGPYTLWASYPPGANQTVYNTTNFTVVQQPSQPQPLTGTGGGGGGGVCLPSWNCSDFSECQPDGTQTRTCLLEQNKCGNTSIKPNETQNCTYVPPAGCTEGSKVCAGSDLMVCLGGQLVKQTCEFGCSNNACNEKPAETGQGNQTGPGGGVPVTGFFLFEPSSWPYWVIILVIIVIIVWYLMGRRKKKKASLSMMP